MSGEDTAKHGCRRVMIVEYDVTQLTPTQVDLLLFMALASGRDVSFRIETTPGSPPVERTPGSLP